MRERVEVPSPPERVSRLGVAESNRMNFMGKPQNIQQVHGSAWSVDERKRRPFDARPIRLIGVLHQLRRGFEL